MSIYVAFCYVDCCVCFVTIFYVTFHKMSNVRMYICKYYKCKYYICQNPKCDIPNWLYHPCMCARVSLFHLRDLFILIFKSSHYLLLKKKIKYFDSSKSSVLVHHVVKIVLPFDIQLSFFWLSSGSRDLWFQIDRVIHPFIIASKS